MKFEHRLEVLILAHRPHREAYPLGVAARVEEDAVSKHVVAQQHRSVVEQRDVEQFARHFVAAKRS